MVSKMRLQSYHCYYLGLMAKSGKKYTLAVEWLMEAKRLAQIDGTTEDIPTINAELVETSKNVREPFFKSHFKNLKAEPFLVFRK